MSKTIFFVVPFKNRIIMKPFLIKTPVWLGRHWFKIVLCGMLLFLLQQKDLNLQFNLSAQPENSTLTTTTTEKGWLSQLNPASLASSLTTLLPEKPKVENVKVATLSPPDNVANTYSNMTYHESSPEPVRSKAELAKLKKQRAYVSRFADVAQAEMKKYGIPASIKLAQGLIETNAGASRLSTKNNNHFGMKCFSRKCRKGHYSNFTDDSHKDIFRIYKSAWSSYRSHSKMLVSNKRYKKLFRLSPTDYRSWAHGLYKAGYATDKKYAEKLIRIIEELDLQEYDS